MCLQSKILLWLVESVPTVGKILRFIANSTKIEGLCVDDLFHFPLPIAEAAKGFPVGCPISQGVSLRIC